MPVIRKKIDVTTAQGRPEVKTPDDGPDIAAGIAKGAYRIDLTLSHSIVEAAAQYSSDSDEWSSFMRDNVRLPHWMLPAVQYAVRQRSWQTASDPLKSIRKTAIRASGRMRLTKEN